MKTIHKYVLDPAVVQAQEVAMPNGAKLLSVQSQQGLLTLWALVDTSRPTVMRKMMVFGTGQAIDLPPGPMDYVGTAQLGSLVWHLFDCGSVPT